MKSEKNQLKNIPKQIYPLVALDKIISYVQKLLCKKYFVSKISYQKLLIKNIIYDDKRRLVSVFKEQLIINDISEYMKKFYKRKESRIKLRKYFELYDKYSRIFPNYTPLIESKYIYTNIHRKQKVIDLQQNTNKNNKIKNNKIIFNSDVYQSIEKISENFNKDIFGIDNNELNNSLIQINNIINNINKYELNFEGIDLNNNISNNINNKSIKNIKNKNIIINNYYYNNNSILTKNIPTESLNTNYIPKKNLSTIKKNILLNQKNKYKSLLNPIFHLNDLNKTNKNNYLSDTINRTNLTTRRNSKNKSINNNISINNTKYSSAINNSFKFNKYKNMKLNSILKKITNSDINNSLLIKKGKNIDKEKLKINRTLVSKIINKNNKNKNSGLITDRIKKKISIITTGPKNDMNKLKIYLNKIKNKKCVGDKQNKINYDIKTDRGIYNTGNINKIIQKQSLIRKNINNNINKKYLSNNLLINKNQEKKIPSVGKRKINTKYINTNTKDISNIINKTTNNSKMKIKGIQIKNFNKTKKVFERNNKSYLKTSERKIKKTIIKPDNKNTGAKKVTKKNIFILKINNNNKTNVLYSEREKIKRLFLLNNDI
jgi:hypothetical protein